MKVMGKFMKLLCKVYEMTGFAVVLFFLMWLVTKLVLLYRPYPWVTSLLPSIMSIQKRRKQS